MLLVVCIDRRTAEWCSAPIALGQPGAQFSPLILGPDRVPVVTDAGDAGRHPELTVLSAMAHGARPDRREVLVALLGALAAVDGEHSALYADVVYAALPEAARRYLEDLMTAGTYKYESDFVRRYIGQGRADGVLAVLDARGVEVPEGMRARITACDDLDELDSWLRRAATADSVDELFG